MNGNKMQTESAEVDAASWVQPIYPVAPKLITLSDLDKFAGPSFVSYAVFFKVSDDLDSVKYYEQLKAGLSRVLYEIPSLAGKLKKDGNFFFQVEIPAAPKAGTFFTFCDLRSDETLPSFEELASKEYPFVDGFSDGLSALVPKAFPNSQDGDPTMMAQLSRLKGGLVLTIGYCHVLGDVVQGWQLGISWARHTSSVAAEAAQLHNGTLPVLEQSPEHYIDRDMLSRYWSNGSKKPAAQESTPDANKPDDIEISANGYDLWESLVPPAHLLPSETAMEKKLRGRTCSMWVMKPAALAKLRERARSAQNGTRISTLDTAAGFLWQRYVLAKLPLQKAVSVEEKETISAALDARRVIWFTMNLRSRLNPPISENFTPNCVGVFSAEVSSQTLLEKSAETRSDSGVFAAGAAVRHCIENFDQQGWADDLRERPALWPARLSYPIDFIMTDHRAFGKVKSTDWGTDLGQPDALREVALGFLRPKPGLIYVMPSDEEGCLTFVICCERIIYERLDEDSEWTSIARRAFVTADEVSG